MRLEAYMAVGTEKRRTALAVQRAELLKCLVPLLMGQTAIAVALIKLL